MAENGYTQKVRLLTFGHGTLVQDQLASLMRSSGIERVVDVRTVPKSRRHPWVWREEMEAWVPRDTGAQYIWCADLGGRRRGLKDSTNVALRHPAFRGYADYMQTSSFANALAWLVAELPNAHVAIMCSETLWWRCHRRLISDAAVLLYGIDVQHLDARGKLKPHVLTEGARREGDRVLYDAGIAA